MSFFLKNLSALNNPYLMEKLKQKHSSTWVMDNRGGVDQLNWINQNGEYLYKNPKKYLEETIALYQNKYLLYPVLYFYGFGSGVLYKCLLNNPNLKHIVVFEDDLELLYSVFSVLDFSNELKERKIIILNSEISNQDLEYLLYMKPFYNFLRIYDMHIHNEYYEKFENNILELNKKISEILKIIILHQGNDIKDSLQGLVQYIYNLPNMIKNPPLKNLWLMQNKKVKSAIVVAAGPSLSKQLPLLKQYQDKFSIFCVDSAYSILAKNDIKPDFVLASERTKLASNLIQQNYKNIDDNIVFILLTLVHPLAIKYLENTDRKFLLIPYPTIFFDKIDLFDFGKSPSGGTVAYNALQLACDFNHENIIFIGQDLAYGEDGSSHAKDYFYGEKFVKENTELCVVSYGGKKQIKTRIMWNTFRFTIQNYIANKKGFKFYNATEGGARIEGTIEKPFKECCEEFLDENLTKPFEKPSPIDKNAQDDLLLQSYKVINDNLEFCDRFVKEFELYFENLIQVENKIQSLEVFEDKKSLIIQSIKNLDFYKTKLDEYCKTFLYEFIRPFLQQFEFNLARIYVINPRTNEEWFDKNIAWVKDHIFLFEILIANIKMAKDEINKHLDPLKDEIRKRQLDNI
ncbi:motility associated factor glycosyltransferase family protein [Campylobacter sp. CNRCH_2016_3089]|uniref:motility associated factor glycosyltransferase family protein n=1 Tax=Campylobacter sp. CNRCH_2016_3089 TaxID=2911609 RepID=UPI0021E6878F|nr:motility associated factor glycosyltransferase family protein [Campylobacter sp. CNRCH_2016_3089]MCV3508186.1 motility associated factor glycosyltransferase family protein [Campylobacter sp. CNRCH_2016_3089]